MRRTLVLSLAATLMMVVGCAQEENDGVADVIEEKETSNFGEGTTPCGDSACEAGEYCADGVAGTCASGCISRFNCADGELCEIPEGQTVGVCEEPPMEIPDAIMAGDGDATEGHDHGMHDSSGPSDPPPFEGGTYILIADLSAGSEDPAAGADIDTVILRKRSGSFIYPKSVAAFRHGSGFEDRVDPLNALGPPDSFYNYPDTEVCDVESGFVSLGGMGGYLVVQMDGEVESGDTIEVLELGNCEFPGGLARVEEVDIAISDHGEPSGEWTQLPVMGESPSIEALVP